MTMGRPLLFDDALRARFLDAVTAGLSIAQAAEHAGIHPDIPARHARGDKAFAGLLAAAKTAGRAVRRDGIPHGEYRYNIHQCRCHTCTTDHAKARANRRTAKASNAEETTGEVRTIRAAAESPSFLLARAS